MTASGRTTTGTPKRILWFTWKDKEHPQTGGAELINETLAKLLVARGYEVLFVVGGFPGAATETQRDGYRIVRVGGKFSVYWHAWRYYRKHLLGWADIVIDEMNTMPFFASWYVQEPHVLFAYQLCREIWFYEMPLPFSLIGYVAEPIYLWLLRNNTVITESESTRTDMARFGFTPAKIGILPMFPHIVPVVNLAEVKKFPEPTVLVLGSIRSMKRTHEAILGFLEAKKTIPQLHLIVAGSGKGKYFNRVQRLIAEHKDAHITYAGRVSAEEKTELMRRCHAILVTSVKEGWGLIVTEAGSQGTPAVVYNVDGLRDSCVDGKTGITTAPNPEALGAGIVQLLSNPAAYERFRNAAWEHNRALTATACADQFEQLLQKIYTAR